MIYNVEITYIKLFKLYICEDFSNGVSSISDFSKEYRKIFEGGRRGVLGLRNRDTGLRWLDKSYIYI